MRHGLGAGAGGDRGRAHDGVWAEAGPAQAQSQNEKRVALVIGNGAYRFTPVLPNPPNDARDMAEALKRLGFADVALVLDATKTEMERAIRSFGRSLNGSSAAVVFYAGHAMQVNGRNLLLPIDAEIKREQDLNYEVVDLGLILSEVDQGKRTNIVILDACRDNPLAEALTRSMRAAGRSAANVGRGLGRIDGAVGTLIAYSTKDGTVASDGTGRNSPYTKALLRHIETPGLPVEAMFKRVREAVLAETGNQQTPWEYGSLIGEFHFNLTVDVAPAVTAAGAPTDRETVFWQSAQASNRSEEYEAYLRQYPQGAYAALAQTRVASLKAQPQVAAAPIPPPSVMLEPIDKEYVATQNARLREQPDVKSRHLAMVKEGDTLLVLGKVKGQPWYQVERKGEAPAYVSDGLLEEASTYKKRQEAGTQQAMVAPTPSPSSAATPAPGRAFRDCPDCPEMVVVPAGSFSMGSVSGEEDEQPVHRVTIERAFGLGKYEVTFAEWDACVAAGGCRHRPSDAGWGRGNRPVINVSWADAQEYVFWLSMQTGKTYRLPSESEWEYAAKGGGSADLGGKTLKRSKEANCDGCGSRWDNMQTAPVGSFAANRFGLHDLLGNVWERVDDTWSHTYVGSPSDGSAWKNGNLDRRVSRGGSWNNIPEIVRSAYRNRDGGADRDISSGFRVARTY